VVDVRDAATVMLVRDAPAGTRGSDDPGGLEVFMLRRNLRSDFVGGAYVFPGGAVDPHDRHADLEAVCEGRTDAEASVQLGIDEGGLAFWVAAVRECFEEAGVLLALDHTGALVRLDDPAVAARFAEHRAAVDRGERRLVDVCRAEGLRLAVGPMYYFAHWITPEGVIRRYDTRFFVARAPDAQTPLHDDREVIANLWIRPSDALERNRAGRFELIFPTYRTLVTLERFASADDLLAAAAIVDEVPAILPRIVDDEGGGVRIVLPGDPGYDELASASLGDGLSLADVRPPAEPPDELGGMRRAAASTA
jgi:8-oxo-dGTP pyrophosphatase MutT (NUDIX family)